MGNYYIIIIIISIIFILVINSNLTKLENGAVCDADCSRKCESGCWNNINNIDYCTPCKNDITGVEINTMPNSPPMNNTQIPPVFPTLITLPSIPSMNNMPSSLMNNMPSSSMNNMPSSSMNNMLSSSINNMSSSPQTGSVVNNNTELCNYLSK